MIYFLTTCFLLAPLIFYGQDITGSWDTVSSKGLIPRYGATSAVIDGKIYVFGGHQESNVIDSLQIFDPLANTWQTPLVSGKMTPRYDLASCVVDGKIYA